VSTKGIKLDKCNIIYEAQNSTTKMFTHTIKDEFLSDKHLLFVVKLKGLSMVTVAFFVFFFQIVRYV
jgi:hypothetical protein